MFERYYFQKNFFTEKKTQSEVFFVNAPPYGKLIEYYVDIPGFFISKTSIK